MGGGEASPISSDPNAAEESKTESQDIEFLGLEKTAAAALAEERKLQWRVIGNDGVVRPVPMKLRDDRVNFVVEKGKVVRVRRG